MGKGQHYMKLGERWQLEAYLKAGKPVAWIAQTMGFCRKTIYNEMNRGAVSQIQTINGIQRDVVVYSAQSAQMKHDYNQTAKGRPLKLGHHHDYAQRLENLMLGAREDGTVEKRRRYSPGAALAITRQEGYPITVSITTLYSYIKKGVFRSVRMKDLWAPRKKRSYRPAQRVAHPQYPSITQRPMDINDRQELGHKEMDLVVGKAGTRAALLTMADRKSRAVIIQKLPNKEAKGVKRALDRLDRNGTSIRSITTDNGPEFLAHRDLVTLATGKKRYEIYYCHSYAAWEKGTIEIHNRMIRRWYPKGTDFTRIPQRELDDLAEWLNHYPRRILGWKTPAQTEQLTNVSTPSEETPGGNRS